MKIATQLSSDLTEVKYEKVSTESILLNELLIEELKNSLINGEGYISRDDVEKLEEYKVLKNELKGLFVTTNTSSIGEVKVVINQLKASNKALLTELNNSELLVDRKAQYVERLKVKIEKQDEIIKKKHSLILKLKEQMKEKDQVIKKKHNLILKLKEKQSDNSLANENEFLKLQVKGYENRKVIKLVNKLAGKN